MYDPVSALNGTVFEGFATVTDTGPRGMITLRGNAAALAKVAKAVGVEMPETLGITTKGDVSLGWMSPDELLVLCSYAETPAIAATCEAAMSKDHALVTIVSDARAVFRVEGDWAADVLRKLTPADVDAVAPGMIRRTRFAQVAAAFWPVDGGYEVMCFRSQAVYVFDLLSNAARAGSELHL